MINLKDNLFKGIETFASTFASITKAIESNNHLIHPLQRAVEQLADSGITQYAGLVHAATPIQVETVGTAYLSGIYEFDTSLAQRLNEIYEPLAAMGNISAIENAFGKTLQELINPSIYISNLTGICSAMDNFTSVVTNIGVSPIDTSYMQLASPWITDIANLGTIDTSLLDGIDTTFSKIAQIEQETSVIPLVAEHFSKITSASTQLVTIGKSILGVADQWREIIAPMRLLDNYSEFVLHQHELIQKAALENDDNSIEWRLGLLDATSKFIDRRIIWANEFAAEVQEEIEFVNFSPDENELDISAIPQYVGYSKRDRSDVAAALAESNITITIEKGRLIVQKAKLIQEICNHTAAGIHLFENTEAYLNSYMVLAGYFCRNKDSLSSVVEALFHLFGEQYEIIASLINTDELHCIEKVKEFRSGKIYPVGQKAISQLQTDLYDSFLLLEDVLIQKLENNAKLQKEDNVSAPSPLSDSLSEEIINRNISKALVQLQSNKIFWGKTEDELNDGVKGYLNMIYETKDQTRQGISTNGNGVGEVDLQICENGLPIAMIEGLKVDSVNRGYIQTHIDKVLVNYDPVGCPYAYVIIYVTSKNFSEFWIRCTDFIKDEYEFPYVVKKPFHEVNHMYTESRHAKVVLERNGRETTVHFYALAMK